ncbi:MAG: diguanylate cyclase protein [Clostridia bacterium]|nr:diguanylate cyclase protein [Clostridia bacterium]
MEARCLDIDKCVYLNNLKSDVDSYQKCVEKSLVDLNNMNIKYEKAIREIGSVFDLFQHINLITDYNNLYAIINDMLIGVLGVTGSTIFSIEDNALLVEASNISRRDLKNVKPIQNKLIGSGCLEGKLTFFKSHEITEELCNARCIKSAVAIPIMNKDKCLMIIFLEHSLENYFEEENKQLLSTLSLAIRLAAENAKLYSNLENMTSRDGMTGLYNCNYFEKEIANCIDVCDKFGIPFTVAVIDIDHFLMINKTYGHLCGDKVIKDIGRLLESEVRKGDIVCRINGDKYGVIFRNTLDTSSIKDRLEKVRTKICQSMSYDNASLQVSCSFGIASTNTCEAGGDYKDVAAFAEEALRMAKEQGRNKVVIYEK